jgi:hypothetical protein
MPHASDLLKMLHNSSIERAAQQSPQSYADFLKVSHGHTLNEFTMNTILADVHPAKIKNIIKTKKT